MSSAIEPQLAAHNFHSTHSQSMSSSSPVTTTTVAEPTHPRSRKESLPSLRLSPHVRPIHVHKAPSLLSRRRRPSVIQGGPCRLQDFAGFKHLAMMVLFIGNLRLFVVDAAQFGFLRALQNVGFPQSDMLWMLAVLSGVYLATPLALIIEIAASRSSLLAGDILTIVQVIIAGLCLSLGTLTVHHVIWHPLIGTLCEATIIVSSLKLASFALTNRELRQANRAKLPLPPLYVSCPYPLNLTAANMCLFWFAPTLVYQPVYPRTPRVRKSVVASLAAEILTGLACIWILAMQMAAPILQHVLVDYQKSQYLQLFDDFLSLASVNIIIWLLGFFVMFQSMLNCLAELTRFADREFYGDWWNAGCVGTFWRDWNRPVSNYFRRHVYVPLRKLGASTFLASNMVFFISAVLHELLFGAPTHNFCGVAFVCMMAQTPLILVTAPLEKMRGPGTTVGNCVFWLSILFGVPTAAVMYYLAWHLRISALSESA